MNIRFFSLRKTQIQCDHIVQGLLLAKHNFRNHDSLYMSLKHQKTMLKCFFKLNEFLENHLNLISKAFFSESWDLTVGRETGIPGNV